MLLYVFVSDYARLEVLNIAPKFEGGTYKKVHNVPGKSLFTQLPHLGQHLLWLQTEHPHFIKTFWKIWLLHIF